MSKGLPFGYIVQSNLEIFGVGLETDCMSLCASLESAEGAYREICFEAEKKHWNSKDAVETIHSKTPQPDVDYNIVYSSWFGIVKRHVSIETWIVRQDIRNPLDNIPKT